MSGLQRRSSSAGCRGGPGRAIRPLGCGTLCHWAQHGSALGAAFPGMRRAGTTQERQAARLTAGPACGISAQLARAAPGPDAGRTRRAAQARTSGPGGHHCAVGLSHPAGADLQKTAHAAEQERPDVKQARLEWIVGQSQLDPSQLVLSTRLAPPPSWRGCMDAHCGERAAGPRFRTDIGRVQPSRRACAKEA